MDKIVEAIKSQTQYYKNIDGTDKLDVDGNRITKKPLSESTIKNYTSTFNKVKQAIEEYSDETFTFSDLSWLEDINRTIHSFNKKELACNTVKTYFNVIVVVMRALKMDVQIMNRYIANRDELNKKYSEEQKSGVISAKQEPNFITIDKYMKMIDDIEGLNPKTWDKKQLLVILKLYLVLPSRNELSEFTKTTKEDFNKTNRHDQSKNWAVMGKKNINLIVNEYKTQGKYGHYKEKLSKEFTNEINEMILSQPESIYLFLNSKGTQLSKNNLSQILIRASNKYIEGSPNVSTTMIRKMIASDLSAEKNVKAKELADKMKHSIDVHNKVYVKTKPK